MADVIKRPSEVGAEVQLNDEETQAFVKENLGFGLQSVMKNDDEYLRNVFYLKCAEVKSRMQSSFEAERGDIFYLSSKENIDVIFECMKKDSDFLQHHFEEIDDKNLGLYSTAFTFVGNDNLYTSFLGETPNNFSVAKSFGSLTLDDIKECMKKLHSQEYEALEQRRISALKEENTDLLPKKTSSKADKLAELSGRPSPSGTTSKKAEKKAETKCALTSEQIIALKAEKEKHQGK